MSDRQRVGLRAMRISAGPRQDLRRYARRRITFLLLGLILLHLGAAMGCSTPKEREDKGAGQIVGAPPSAADDPYFIAFKPEEAVEVSAAGELEPSDELEAQETEAEPRTTALDAQARPAEESGPPPPAEPASEQCFSCVRICPEGQSCDEYKEDIICGWGAHKDAALAQKLAKAECDATLDLARQMPVWSRIDGECPQATCR